ncbi:unnamed protein product [Kuraishia capsulata CBS 1993]|uniref:Uncharacterized protein n=1 Tax=Kuraishia capsulata CBS 1993 TaxID=1382522 RepID=W6MVL1_9ASCO|nr:uncharacterized protein KUCA_T00005987001 [Kuraishia capsulata CBS 1993]CDK29992.1 unnamed protein product [Kuraishia capsulata CBS 1993]
MLRLKFFTPSPIGLTKCVRLYSSVSKVIPRELKPYHDRLSSLNDSGEARDVVEASETDSELNEDFKSQLYNQVIRQFARSDYSVVNEFSGKLTKLGKHLEPGALIEAIKYNPGRVNTSWEIYEKFAPNAALEASPVLAQILYLEVLEKLCLGELIDIEEGYEMDEKSLGKAFQLVGKLVAPVPESLRKVLVEACIKLDLVPMIALLEVQDAHLEDLILTLENEEEKILQLWKLVNESSANVQVFKTVIPVIARNIKEESGKQEKLQKFIKNAQISEDSALKTLLDLKASKLLENTLKRLQDLKADSGAHDDALGVRLLLLKSIGIYSEDLKKTLELFHKYQSVEKYKREDLQKSMAVILAYHSVLSGNQILLQVSESMIPQTPIPAECTAALILANGALGNPENSLDIYNANIQNVSKDNLNQLEISDSALLTESLIAVYLGQQDRDFAELIRNGATSSGLISRDTGVTRVKAMFKNYGDLVEEADTESRLNAMLIGRIKDLA